MSAVGHVTTDFMCRTYHVDFAWRVATADLLTKIFVSTI